MVVKPLFTFIIKLMPLLLNSPSGGSFLPQTWHLSDSSLIIASPGVDVAAMIASSVVVGAAMVAFSQVDEVAMVASSAVNYQWLL